MRIITRHLMMPDFLRGAARGISGKAHKRVGRMVSEGKLPVQALFGQEGFYIDRQLRICKSCRRGARQAGGLVVHYLLWVHATEKTSVIGDDAIRERWHESTGLSQRQGRDRPPEH